MVIFLIDINIVTSDRLKKEKNKGFDLKKIIFSIALFLISTGQLFAAQPYEKMADKLLSKIPDKKAAIAVLPFKYSGRKSVGETVANELINALSDKGAVIVERASLDRVMEEMSLQQTGITSDDTAAQVGKGLGAKYLIVGSVKDFTKPGYSNTGLKIQARVVTVETGKILTSYTIEVEKSDMTSEYRRREPRGPARYPSMLSFGYGWNFHEYKLIDDEDNEADYSSDVHTLTLEYIAEGEKMFFTTWDLQWKWGSVDFGEFSYNDYYALGLSRKYMFRLPLWRYIDALPFLTHMYFGLSGKFTGYSFVPKDEVVSSSDSEFTIAWNAKMNLHAGVKIGLTDFLLLSVEYVYSPELINLGYYKPTQTSSDSYSMKEFGNSINFALVFTP